MKSRLLATAAPFLALALVPLHVVVATGDEDTSRVRAQLFFGSSEGLGLVPAWSWPTQQVAGSVLAPAGDVNGDGFGDGVGSWDGRDERGGEVPAGLYFAVLTTEGRSERARIVRLR